MSNESTVREPELAADAPAATEEPLPRRRWWLGKPGPDRDPNRPQRTLTLLLLAGLLLPFVTAVFEWTRFRGIRVFFFPTQPWKPWDGMAIWILALKTYLVLLPAIIVCVLLARRGWTRTAECLFLLAAVLVLAWAGADLETFTRTGVHVTYYTQFLNAPDAARWAGDTNTIVREATLAVLPLMGVSALAVIVAGVFATVAWRRRGRRGGLIVAALLVAHVLMFALIIPAQALLTPQWRLRDLQRVHDLLPYDLAWTALGKGLVDVDAFKGPLNKELEPILRKSWPIIFAGAPVDTSPAAIPNRAGPRPNVVVILLDSLRADVLTPEVMPRLSALAKEGLVLRNHHAGARNTHIGIFTVLYGRTGGTYRQTLFGRIPPQACVSFRGAGYQTSYVSGVPHFRWMRMDHFLKEPVFDRMRIVGLNDWATSDKRALAHTRRILAGEEPPAPADGAAKTPQFVTVFLAATHYPYVYPEEFATRTPAIDETWSILSADPTRDREALVNRFHNACAFLDDAVGKFIDSIDRSNTVVVIAGDHGESFWEDGFLTHGTRWSDVQSHVPCVIVGPGVKSGERLDVTTHDDLLPTLLHLAGGEPVRLRNTTGDDLLAPPETMAPMSITAGDTQIKLFEILVRLGDRRLLLEMRESLPLVIVRGSVDAKGNIDAYGLPPASAAPEWARHIGDLLTRMSELPPAHKIEPPLSTR